MFKNTILKLSFCETLAFLISDICFATPSVDGRQVLQTIVQSP
jgi:hypothetical protein